MATRKNRGLRTATERATAAAQSAATTFEDLPSSPLGEMYLRPIAILLRRYFGSASRARAEAAEDAYDALLEQVRAWEPAARRRPGATTDSLLYELHELLNELDVRLENYRVLATSSQEAADEGLVLATRMSRLLTDAKHSCWRTARALEAVGFDG